MIALNAMLLLLGAFALAASPSSGPVQAPQSDVEEGECFKIQVYYWIDDEDEEPQNVINQCPPVDGDGYLTAVVAHQPVPVEGVDSGVGVVVLVPMPPTP